MIMPFYDLDIFADPAPQKVEADWFDALERVKSREDPGFELPWAFGDDSDE